MAIQYAVLAKLGYGEHGCRLGRLQEGSKEHLRRQYLHRAALHQNLEQDSGRYCQKFSRVGVVWLRGACEGLGIKAVCKDMGADMGIRLELDATAAQGILDRQGKAKVRHIDVNCLWLQEQCV